MKDSLDVIAEKITRLINYFPEKPSDNIVKELIRNYDLLSFFLEGKINKRNLKEIEGIDCLEIKSKDLIKWYARLNLLSLFLETIETTESEIDRMNIEIEHLMEKIDRISGRPSDSNILQICGEKRDKLTKIKNYLIRHQGKFRKEVRPKFEAISTFRSWDEFHECLNSGLTIRESIQNYWKDIFLIKEELSKLSKSNR